MNTPETAIRQRLLDDAAVSALVSTRISTGVANQGDALPAIVITGLPQNHTRSLTQPTGLVMGLVQVDSYSVDFDNVTDISDAVREAIDGFRGVVTMEDLSTFTFSSISLQEDEPGIDERTNMNDIYVERRTQEFGVGYAESVPTH